MGFPPGPGGTLESLKAKPWSLKKPEELPERLGGENPSLICLGSSRKCAGGPCWLDDLMAVLFLPGSIPEASSQSSFTSFGQISAAGLSSDPDVEPVPAQLGLNFYRILPHS